MDEFRIQINQIIDQKLESMTNLTNPNHAHNGYDVNQIDPAIGLLGFPVIQVADATASPILLNPNDTPPNGTFRFYVDTTPNFVLWAYLTYVTATTHILTGGWHKLTLT